MFHSNLHKQPYTLATLVSSTWQLVTSSAMSLLHINNLAQSDAAMEKVFPSSAPMHIRKTNTKQEELVDLQEIAANSASPPRSIDAVTQPAELVNEGKPENGKRRKRVHNRKKNTKGEADQAEIVSAGVVEGGNAEQQSEPKKEVKEKRVRTRQNKKQQGDVIDVVVPQGDEPAIPETAEQQKPRQKKENKKQNNDIPAATEPVTETTTEKGDEANEEEDEDTPKQTKGNRRRQRQRQNKKNAKLLAQKQLQEQQEQGDSVDGVENSDTAHQTSPPVSPPPVEAVKPQPPKQKKQPAQPKQKKQQTKQQTSPKVEEHSSCGQYKHSALKHLFVKQPCKDATSTDSLHHHLHHEDSTIRPIRQPKGPTGFGDRGFSAEYRRSRTVQV